MPTYYVETAHGPYLWICMQDFHEMDCASCGRAIGPEEGEWERVEFDDGTFGQQPHCKPCYEKHVRPYE